MAAAEHSMLNLGRGVQTKASVVVWSAKVHFASRQSPSCRAVDVDAV
jgi:hypothetical protein